MSVQQVPKTFRAEEAENLEEIEKQFAVKAVIHAQTYWNILRQRRGSALRLTKHDDAIYAHLQSSFPEFSAQLPIDEDAMKSTHGKKIWREFMMKYENLINDYNFGTLLRRDAKDEYEEKTTIFAPRMQFYAVEIARNREGLNDWIFEAAEHERAEEKNGKKSEDKQEEMGGNESLS